MFFFILFLEIWHTLRILIATCCSYIFAIFLSTLFQINSDALSSLFIYFIISFHCFIPQLPPTFAQLFFGKCLFLGPPYPRWFLGNMGILLFLLGILCVNVKGGFLSISVSYHDVYILRIYIYISPPVISSSTPPIAHFLRHVCIYISMSCYLFYCVVSFFFCYIPPVIL